MTRRRGASLIELIVTLAVMAIVGSVVSLALPQLPLDEGAGAQIRNARREAIALRRPVTVRLKLAGGFADATAHPDGCVTADSALMVNPLTGEAHATR